MSDEKKPFTQDPIAGINIPPQAAPVPALAGNAGSMPEDLSKTDKSDKRFFTLETNPATNESDPLAQILADLKKSYDSSAKKGVRLSFEVDPQAGYSNYQGLFKEKTSLIPNQLLKRIRDTEELIGGVILPVRSRQISLFARPRANRFDIGFTVNIKPQLLEEMGEEKVEKLKKEEIPKIKELLLNCGSNDGVKDKDKRTLSQYFMEIIEDALTFGWFSTEIINTDQGKFHSFRAVDAGTIYFAAPKADAAEEIRAKALDELNRIRNGDKDNDKVKVDPDKFLKDDYTWVQVVHERPRQFFTDDELLVWTLNPSTDILRSGYPVTIFDRIINAITTHINITTHNKMYFINGRASRNILVFKSENLDKEDVEMIRAQMNAHINSSNAAWRMPVFGVGPQDDVATVPLDAAGRDMEFQYLSDLTKRIIFAAFQMSPDEVAALSYLSRGTNSQSLAEANNEWKLIAARDIGLRPILLSLEDFLNERLLPKINPDWAKVFYIDLEGLDADSPEKEATRLQQDSALYLTMNDIMDRVEKKKLPLAGEFPMNPAYMQTLEKYYTKGQILKAYGGDAFKDADKNPLLDYCLGDPTYLQIRMPQQPQPGNDPQGGGDPNAQGGGDLDSALAQLQETMGLNKAEKDLPALRKQLFKKHKEIKDATMDKWQKEAEEMMDKIMASIGGGEDEH